MDLPFLLWNDESWVNQDDSTRDRRKVESCDGHFMMEFPIFLEFGQDMRAPPKGIFHRGAMLKDMRYKNLYYSRVIRFRNEILGHHESNESQINNPLTLVWR